MTDGQRQMHLGAFFMPTGHHVTSWRHPEAQADAGVNFAHYIDIARTAERGKFDMIFLADSVTMRSGHMDALSRSAQYIANFEPLTLLAALASVTERIGLVATATTSYNEPYHIARKFASLDFISSGRAGWNIVTSARDNEAFNFGREAHYPHEERYERAREFTNVVLGLWESWDDDAFIRNKESGLFFDPEKVHVLDHKGPYFSVRGPLNVPRTPQGHPVLVQAGSSETGRDFAAEFGEVIFTAHLTFDDAQKFYADLKGRVASRGRNPDHVKILPGLSFIVAPTEAEAQAKFEHLQSLIHPMVARELVSMTLGGVDLSDYPMDGPLPDLSETNASQSTFDSVMRLARREQLTIRQLGMRLAAGRQRLHVNGTPEQIADLMEQWFKDGAADGFNVLPPYLPGALNDFVDLVIPELQRRGLFRTEYEGRTLRENLGLPRPEGPYARTHETFEPGTTSGRDEIKPSP
jgi:FMN-dependent oxidoreductase (nitrilotriacetate monooxygenase family)